MQIFSTEAALTNLKANRYAIWARGGGDDSPGDNPDYAGHRVQHDLPQIHARRPADLTELRTLHAIGSCFAREIECAFARAGYTVLSNDDEYLLQNIRGPRPARQIFNALDFAADDPWGPGTYTNRYTTASLLLELERTIGDLDLPEEAMLFPVEEGILDLHFASGCRPGDAGLVQRRRIATREITRRLAEADLIVVTLGLIEAWYDRSCDYYVNSAPGRRVLQRSAGRFEMHRLDFADNLRNLERSYALIRSANRRAQLVVTVSPVPLQATFTEDDVVVANSASKSILRAVADTFCSTHADVLYFPSYELVSNASPKIAWYADRRHVTPMMVDHVVSSFMNCKKRKDHEPGS